MNVNVLISRFFPDATPAIEVFDQKSIYAVYGRLQEMLRDFPDIELSVLQALAYCFYEVMDNVLIHSGNHLLRYEEGEPRVYANGFWQGVLVYFEINSAG